eukprot:gene11224-biopygen1822
MRLLAEKWWGVWKNWCPISAPNTNNYTWNWSYRDSSPPGTRTRTHTPPCMVRKWLTVNVLFPLVSQDTGAGVARARVVYMGWGGYNDHPGVRYRHFLVWVARAWRGHGAGLSCDPWGGRAYLRRALQAQCGPPSRQILAWRPTSPGSPAVSQEIGIQASRCRRAHDTGCSEENRHANEVQGAEHGYGIIASHPELRIRTLLGGGAVLQAKMVAWLKSIFSGWKIRAVPGDGASARKVYACYSQGEQTSTAKIGFVKGGWFDESVKVLGLMWWLAPEVPPPPPRQTTHAQWPRKKRVPCFAPTMSCGGPKVSLLEDRAQIFRVRVNSGNLRPQLPLSEAGGGGGGRCRRFIAALCGAQRHTSLLHLRSLRPFLVPSGFAVRLAGQVGLASQAAAPPP